MQPDATGCDSNKPESDDQTATGKATEQRPGRGVRSLDRLGKASPFGVEWRVDGRRKTEWFKNASDRDRRAASLRREKRANTLGQVLSREESQEWALFKLAIGDADWRHVIAAWKDVGGRSAGMTVAEVVQRYLTMQDQRLADDRLAKVTHKKNCPKARMFAADFGSIPVLQVTGQQIEEWIDDLGFEAEETFNTYRKVIYAIFEGAKKECPFNPASEVELRRHDGDVGIISVEETATLLRHAKEHIPEVLPRLALEAFVGLRFSSAFRLEKSDINFEDRGILLPAHKLKTGKRHYIDGLPENLWSWLSFETPATWAITPREYLRLKSKCFDDAKVPHPHNCLRHGFCTYHVAAFKNPGRTATILCHRDQNLLWTRYNGRATQRNGLAYFQLVPADKSGRSTPPPQQS